MPLHVHKGGLVGPELTALIAFMKGIVDPENWTAE